MRVLQVVTRWVIRGVPRHVLTLATGLDPERFQVDVVAGRGEPGEGSLHQEAEDAGVRILQVPTLQRAIAPVADFRALLHLYRLIRRGGYDLVHTHISKAGILGRLAARSAGVGAVVHTYHGQVGEVEAAGPTGSLFRAMERGAARLTGRIIAVSRSTQRQCLAHGIGRAEQYRVIHNGIDVERFRAWEGPVPVQAQGRGPLVVFVGSLAPEKRVDLLLRAVARWTAGAGDPPRLLIVGDGPVRSELERLGQTLGLEERLVFTGLVRDVRPWLAAATVVVMPSVREGLPTVLLEAQAMGRPVVASRVGGVPEIVEHGVTGLLVAPERVEALREALVRLLADAEVREEMGRAGRARVAADFDLGTMLRRTEALYRELCAPGAGRP